MNYEADRRLVFDAKNGCDKAIETLYKKYLPLVKKREYKLPEAIRDDYMGESFISFIKALDYISFEKLESAKTFSFYIFFLNELRNLSNKLMREYNKELQREYHMSYERMFEGEEEDGEVVSETYSMSRLIDDSKFYMHTPERESNLAKAEKLTEKFFSTLDSFEKRILDLKRSGMKLTEISKMEGVSVAKIKSCVYALKGRANTVIMSNC